ncbi:MAG: 5'-nucleotidase C-terminal domain-containing protein [bacterium]
MFHLFFLFSVLFLNNNFDHIYLLYTNDIEGGLSPSTARWMNPYFPPPVGNAPAAAYFIKSKRMEADSLGYGIFIFDSGDMFMGSPIGEFSRGQAVSEYFNYCGYNVVAPGNHDYDMGVEVFREFVNSVDAEFLGSNIVYEKTQENVDYLKPYTIIEHNGIRIGIFSILTHYMEGMTTPAKFMDHDVLDESATARKYVDILQTEDVDLIFALTGIGLKHDKRIASSVPGIDIIFGSHSSSALQSPYEDSINHTIICQSYSHLSSIGFLDLFIDRKTKKIAGYEGRLIDLLSEEIESDTQMLHIVNKWEEITQRGFDEVIGYSNEGLVRAGFEETGIGNMITDAMREYFTADIAIHNSGGIRANMPKGEITYRDCYNVDALSNTIVVMNMTGEVLLEAFEIGYNGHHAIFQISGIRLRYNSKEPIGQRIVDVVTEDGAKLDRNKVYRVVTNSYLAAGGGEYAIFRKATDIEDTFHYMRNIIAEYVKKHSPIEAPIEGRITDVSKQ